MMPGFGFDPREDIRSFGAVGKVVSIASSTIVVGDLNNVEKLISIDGQTIIKFGNDSLKLSDVKIGQNVAVFGAPSTDGSVTAKLIRVMPDDFNPQSKMMNATNSKRK